MRADKLRAWLQRERVGCVKFRLCHDQGDGIVNTIAEFKSDPLPDDQAIFDACADYADGLQEEVRVAIQALNDDGEQIAVRFHIQQPEEAASEDHAAAGSVSNNSITAQLMRHIEVLHRVNTGSMLRIHEAFERIIASQQRSSERQDARIQAMTEMLQEMRLERAVRGEGEGEDEESRVQRAVVTEKLVELLPVVGQYMLAAAAAKAGVGTNGAHYTPPAAGEG